MEIICFGAGKNENPENTLKAIKHCTDLNNNWTVQIDLQLTKDGEVVLLKKRNTKCITGLDKEINELTLKEVKTLNAAHCFKQDNEYIYRNNKQDIPTLKEVFLAFKNTKFLIDIHSTNKKIVFKTIEIVKQFNMQKQIIITSKQKQIISLFKQEEKDWNYAATTVGTRKILYENMFYIDSFIPEDSNLLIIPKSDKDSLFLRKRLINFCVQKDKKTWTWIFEDSKNNLSLFDQILKLQSFGVDGIFISSPEKLNNELAIHQEEKLLQSIYKVM